MSRYIDNLLDDLDLLLKLASKTKTLEKQNKTFFQISSVNEDIDENLNNIDDEGPEIQEFGDISGIENASAPFDMSLSLIDQSTTAVSSNKVEASRCAVLKICMATLRRSYEITEKVRYLKYQTK